jgi:hypothetical protein
MTTTTTPPWMAWIVRTITHTPRPWPRALRSGACQSRAMLSYLVAESRCAVYCLFSFIARDQYRARAPRVLGSLPQGGHLCCSAPVNRKRPLAGKGRAAANEEGSPGEPAAKKARSTAQTKAKALAPQPDLYVVTRCLLISWPLCSTSSMRDDVHPTVGTPRSGGAVPTPGEALRYVYGHRAFRPGQDIAVARVMAGESTLVVQPTGMYDDGSMRQGVLRCVVFIQGRAAPHRTAQARASRCATSCRRTCCRCSGGASRSSCARSSRSCRTKSSASPQSMHARQAGRSSGR